jgi:hypothetical protein
MGWKAENGETFYAKFRKNRVKRDGRADWWQAPAARAAGRTAA